MSKAVSVSHANPADKLWHWLSAFGLIALLSLAALPGAAQNAELAEEAQDLDLSEEASELVEESGDALLPTRPVTFADLAEQVSPAVVNITTSTVVSSNTGPQGVVPEGSPFEDFFEDFNDNGNRRAAALGSGFVISADGFIVTNNHVIEGADEIEIEFFPGEGQPTELLPAVVIGTDPNTDIAVLKVEYDQPLRYVAFGDSDAAPGG